MKYFLSQRMAFCRRNGFSLIEAAIVLGIVGLVVGGIWAVAADARASAQANQFHQQTLNLVKSVRDYYAARALPSGAADITATLRTGGRFPEEMCPANCVSAPSATIRNAYGGTVTVGSVGGSSNQFTIEYDTVTQKGCIQLAELLSARSAEVGLASYTAYWTEGGTPRTTFPIPLATIKSDCNHTTNHVLTYFKIRN